MFSQLCHLYDVINETVEKIVTEYRAEVRCHKGCADCCHAMFDISLIEACYLAEQLQKAPQVREHCLPQARTAQEQFQQLRHTDTDPATARIRCPLLAEDDSCQVYQARPINCRTYGTPTVINGQGHVCGLSGFKKGHDYPTIDLAPLHEQLYRSSEEIAPGYGGQRYTIAQVILATERFLINP